MKARSPERNGEEKVGGTSTSCGMSSSRELPIWRRSNSSVRLVCVRSFSKASWYLGVQRCGGACELCLNTEAQVSGDDFMIEINVRTSESVSQLKSH